MCEPERGLPVGRILAVLAVVAVLPLAAAVAASLAEAFALAVFAVAASLLVALVRVLRYGGLRRPAKFKVRARTFNRAAPNSRLRALPAPRLAITAARAVPGVVLGAAEGERVEA